MEYKKARLIMKRATKETVLLKIQKKTLSDNEPLFL